MPEIAEVEIVRRGLQRLEGQMLIDLEAVDTRLGIAAAHEKKQLLGSEVSGLRRHGKLLGIELNGRKVIAIHLRMTGQLRFGSAATVARAVFTFDKDLVSFTDQRGFGTVDVVPVREFGARLGPDLFEGPLMTVAQNQGLGASRRAVKAILLDQGVVAGIGNYLADEALWRSSLNPEAQWRDLSERQRLAVLAAAKSIAEEALSQGGVTIRDYRDVEGRSGQMQLRLRCYGRAGQPCDRCGTSLAKAKVAGRGSTFCPRCQKAP